jgi:hypothetical protein
VPQSVAQLEKGKVPQVVAQSSEVLPQIAGQLSEVLFSIPWGHHRHIMDKCSEDPANNCW